MSGRAKVHGHLPQLFSSNSSRPLHMSSSSAVVAAAVLLSALDLWHICSPAHVCECHCEPDWEASKSQASLCATCPDCPACPDSSWPFVFCSLALSGFCVAVYLLGNLHGRRVAPLAARVTQGSRVPLSVDAASTSLILRDGPGSPPRWAPRVSSTARII